MGFAFLLAVIDDLNPLAEVSRGALEPMGPRMMQQEVMRKGFASIEYLLDRASQGLTLFFITNPPGELPEVVFRQIDNLIRTGLAHSGRALRALRRGDAAVAGCRARSTEAMVVGRTTGGFPPVADVDVLPEGFPPTGVTRSSWEEAA